MIPGLTINRKLHFFAFRTRHSGWLCSFLTAALLLTFAPPGRGTIAIPTPPKEKRSSKTKDATPLPPQAAPVAVQVPAGGTVQIPLRIFGRQEQTTGFLIRKEPALGKIVSLQPVEQEVWLLTYQHTAPMNEQASAQDRILFAAQNKNGTSSAAEITITIMDPPPDLSAPGTVEFGDVPAGLSAIRLITIANKGGGVLEGNVTADAPWSIEPSGFRLRRGEQAQLRLSFAPDSEREYQGRLHFNGGAVFETNLHAHAFAPFTIAPATLELIENAAKGTRTGTFLLTNRSPQELLLQIDANPRFHLPSQIALPPKSVAELTPSLAREDSEGAIGTVRITSGAISRTLHVHAMGTQPSPTPAASSAAATPPPQIFSTPATESAPTPAPEFASAHAETTPAVDPAALKAAVLPVLGAPETLPWIQDLKIVRTTANGIAEFSWTPPQVPGASDLNYRVEIRRLGFYANRKLTQNWIPVPGVQFTKKPDRVTALITGIPSGMSNTAHILALAADEPCAQSTPFQFSMPLPLRLFTLRNVLLAGFTLLLLAGGILNWLQKKAS